MKNNGNTAINIELEETLESFLENVKSGEVDEGQAEIWRKVMKVLPFNKGNTSKNGKTSSNNSNNDLEIKVKNWSLKKKLEYLGEKQPLNGNEKEMMETFGVLANDDNEKVYSKVAEKCLEIAKKGGTLPTNFAGVLKVLAGREEKKANMSALNSLKKLDTGELEEWEFLRVLRVLVEKQGKEVAKMCKASLKFAEIFKILISKDDKDIDSEVLKKLKELGKKDVYVKDGEFGKLLKLLADKGNKDADTMYKRHMKGKKAVGFLQKANPFF